ncbi:uncharacterized protein LOC121925591 [Sceloporus undulatus]|uniref:uncharacterized protein LOC121925591 n=1 Tax=Sceloporus undulatus TaxID=8520 RepID=UPI001C4A92F0|nr:uncharacterized protein LOC121925591 [Sceloporus undulatus]
MPLVFSSPLPLFFSPRFIAPTCPHCSGFHAPSGTREGETSCSNVSLDPRRGQQRMPKRERTEEKNEDRIKPKTFLVQHSALRSVHTLIQMKTGTCVTKQHESVVKMVKESNEGEHKKQASDLLWPKTLSRTVWKTSRMPVAQSCSHFTQKGRKHQDSNRKGNSKGDKISRSKIIQKKKGYGCLASGDVKGRMKGEIDSELHQ